MGFNTKIPTKQAIATILAVLVGLYFVVRSEDQSIKNSHKPPTASELDDSARYKSRALVSASLKAPSTAKFCGDEVKPFQFAGADAWEINGCVDAQNSYGAMIRNNYKVVLTRWGGEWRVASLEIH